MTELEKLIRAREACAAVVEHPTFAANYRSGLCDDGHVVKSALRALDDLDKPIPDPDEEWRPFLTAVGFYNNDPMDHADRARIARIKAARHLMPPEGE